MARWYDRNGGTTPQLLAGGRMPRNSQSPPSAVDRTSSLAVGWAPKSAGMRALSALLNPTVNSYKRFGPDTLAPWLIDWGFREYAYHL